MIRTYLEALAAHDAAFAKFKLVRDAYRALTVGDDEFLAARVEFNNATKVFDAAYDAETMRNTKKAKQMLNDFSYVGSVHHY